MFCFMPRAALHRTGPDTGQTERHVPISPEGRCSGHSCYDRSPHSMNTLAQNELLVPRREACSRGRQDDGHQSIDSGPIVK